MSACTVTPSLSHLSLSVTRLKLDLNYLLLITAISYVCSAAITLKFRVLGSDGLLFYVANNDQPPTQWLLSFIQRGYIHFNVQTAAMESNTIVSNYQYANGNWTTVTLLWVNDFMAMVRHQ